jgi:hypothetical protein
MYRYCNSSRGRQTDTRAVIAERSLSSLPGLTRQSMEQPATVSVCIAMDARIKSGHDRLGTMATTRVPAKVDRM